MIPEKDFLMFSSRIEREYVNFAIKYEFCYSGNIFESQTYMFASSFDLKVKKRNRDSKKRLSSTSFLQELFRSF